MTTKNQSKTKDAAGQGSSTNEKKLQKLLSTKEAQLQALMQEFETLQQETEMLRVQRDAARALIEKQNNSEPSTLQESVGYKGLLMGIGIGILFSVVVGGAFLAPMFTEEVKPPPEPTPIPTEPINKLPIVTTPSELPKPLGSYRDPLKNGEKGPLMVKLPGSTFEMGSKNSLPYFEERPQHDVTLEAFSIGKYEVTFEEYDQFARDTGNPLPYDRDWGRGKRPVINVNWHEATEYTQWLSEQTDHQYRLPSEREWEYAAKAGSDTLFWWGAELGENNANCGHCGSQWDGKQTAPVGSFKPNLFEIYDTIGNVMEWTLNCRSHSYQYAPAIGNKREGGDCLQRMVRSSSYKSYMSNLRTTKRNHFPPGARIDALGFRVVRVD